ncbi:hypothetical protein PENTCL1PPCAC_10252, partial [Pristionchus entomophagus]
MMTIHFFLLPVALLPRLDADQNEFCSSPAQVPDAVWKRHSILAKFRPALAAEKLTFKETADGRGIYSCPSNDMLFHDPEISTSFVLQNNKKGSERIVNLLHHNCLKIIFFG